MNNSASGKQHFLSSAVLEQLDQGNTIEAIKLLREETGMSLFEAKEYIDSVKTTSAAGIPQQTAAKPVISHMVLDQLMRGNKLEAIKILRNETGMGLKDAKDAVEQALVEHPEVNHQYETISKQGMKSSSLKFMVILIIAYLAYRFFIVS